MTTPVDPTGASKPDEPQASCRRCDWRGPRADLPAHAAVSGHPVCVVPRSESRRCGRSLTEFEVQCCDRCLVRVRVALTAVGVAFDGLGEAVLASGWRGQLGGDALVLAGDGATQGLYVPDADGEPVTVAHGSLSVGAVTVYSWAHGCAECGCGDLAGCEACACRVRSAYVCPVRVPVLLPGERVEHPAYVEVRGEDPKLRYADNWPSDPTPVLAELESWERAWRREWGQPPADDLASVPGCVAYLSGWLDRAANGDSVHGPQPEFDEFAWSMSRLRSRVEHAAGLANDPLRAVTDCLDCGGRLVADYEPPRLPYVVRVSNAGQALRAAVGVRRGEQAAARRVNEQARRARPGVPDEQLDLVAVPADLSVPELRMIVTATVVGHAGEGLRSEHADGVAQPVWRCSRCPRVYSHSEYRLAQRSAIDGVDGWVTVAVASEQTGRGERLIRYWAAAGKVGSRRAGNGRLLVKLAECRALVGLRGRKVSFA